MISTSAIQRLGWAGSLTDLGGHGRFAWPFGLIAVILMTYKSFSVSLHFTIDHVEPFPNVITPDLLTL